MSSWAHKSQAQRLIIYLPSGAPDLKATGHARLQLENEDGRECCDGGECLRAVIGRAWLGSLGSHLIAKNAITSVCPAISS
jgi:hypothetical protein